ncbi:MAG: hypothetical protein IJ083_12060 [Clostridia bacterium]|nr:hypothetical protein [Clostridia bacterium]
MYLRARSEERTGFQEAAPFEAAIDLQSDFVMVYGIGEDTLRRAEAYRAHGYITHQMLGLCWGEYGRFVSGAFDGKDHMEDAQLERGGQRRMHGGNVPYLVPTRAFADYLKEELRRAMDGGMTRFFLEEPEFWDEAGYAPAFRAAYEETYDAPFRGQHVNCNEHVLCAQLKAKMFLDFIRDISDFIYTYGRDVLGRETKVAVCTHSVLNYSQWKIVSPESRLLSLPHVDEIVGQVWTGTARVGNVYEGRFQSRTFECAYLEFSALSQFQAPGGKTVYFLNDPIEDAQGYDWADYEENYRKTAVASLLFPEVTHFEICPWPHRVFTGSYPRVQPNLAAYDETGYETPQSRTIPEGYRTFLGGMFQLFGNMAHDTYHMEGDAPKTGILLSDTCLYARTYPDTVEVDPAWLERLYGTINRDGGEASRPYFRDMQKGSPEWNSFVTSVAFPGFYGLAMPLVKAGLPVRVLQMDEVLRNAEHLRDMDVLIVSFEFQKPLSMEHLRTLASWARDGGLLILSGDGSDPFHGSGWWRDEGHRTALDAMKALLGLEHETSGLHDCAKGHVLLLPEHPALYCLEGLSEGYRRAVAGAMEATGLAWEQKNHFLLRRGPYLICHVMEESISSEPLVLRGLFLDQMADGFPVIREKAVAPGEGAVLLDLDAVRKAPCILCTCARILSMEEEKGGLHLVSVSPLHMLTQIRLYLASIAEQVEATAENGQPLQVQWEMDAESHTLLLTYRSAGGRTDIRIR